MSGPNDIGKASCATAAAMLELKPMLKLELMSLGFVRFKREGLSMKLKSVGFHRVCQSQNCTHLQSS